jgi:Raf kinase inhibitor-like YbhB/YbcL family protein
MSKGGFAVNLQIKSGAFDQGALIPKKYTCDGEDISPPLMWSAVPPGAQSLVLIMDDPDAPVGNWDHWILFNLPPQTTGLAENIKTFPAGTVSGQNSWRRIGCGGPCPPDREHRYFFKLYALDAMLYLKEGITKKELESAMQNHILGKSELMGKYDRKR